MLKKILKTKKKNEIKLIEDEFLPWLNFVNPGMLTVGNIYCMNYAISKIKSDSPIIEIGAFCGLSTNIMSYLTNKHKKKNKIISSDKWIFEGAENGGLIGNSKITHEEYRSFVIETLKRNLRFFSSNQLPSPIELFSDDFFENWRLNKSIEDIFGRQTQLGGSISFAFIDGNHTYEYTKRDFENVKNYLEPGGFILFDDSYDGTKLGCGELMPEILDDNDFQFVMKNPNYLFKRL